MWPFKKKEPLRVETNLKKAILEFSTLDGERFTIIVNPTYYTYAMTSDKKPVPVSVDSAINEELRDAERRGFFRVDDRLYPTDRVKMGRVIIEDSFVMLEWEDGWRRL